MNVDRVSAPARQPRSLKVLEIPCSTCGKDLKLVRRARIARLLLEVQELRALLADAVAWDDSLTRDDPETKDEQPEWKRAAREVLLEAEDLLEREAQDQLEREAQDRQDQLERATQDRLEQEYQDRLDGWAARVRRKAGEAGGS